MDQKQENSFQLLQPGGPVSRVINNFAGKQSQAEQSRDPNQAVQPLIAGGQPQNGVLVQQFFAALCAGACYVESPKGADRSARGLGFCCLLLPGTGNAHTGQRQKYPSQQMLQAKIWPPVLRQIRAGRGQQIARACQTETRLEFGNEVSRQEEVNGKQYPGENQDQEQRAI